jgi:hypothetical protein
MPNENTKLTSGEEQTAEQPRRGVIAGRTFQVKMINYSPIDGQAIFEGDIVLGSVAQLDAAYEAIRDSGFEGSLEGIAITGSQHRWPNGKIPFLINPNLPDRERVEKAIKHWEQKTPISFHQRTTEIDYVEFRPSTVCNSAVGRQGGPQFVNLGLQCATGNVIHEIGHVVGLWHEHSREDRDNFITIDLTNIDPGKIHNFNQHVTDGDDVGDYDYGSIMHYSAFAFARDQSRPTIISKNGAAIGQRESLSAGDIAAVKKVYGF